METQAQPVYSTWIRVKKIRLFWILALLPVAVALLLMRVSPYFVWLALVSLPFLYIAVVITLTARLFSEEGGGYQAKIHALIIDSTEFSGRILDIGCGSGHLAIRIAKKIAKTTANPVVGIDFWGDDWEYSHNQCATNAQTERVSNTSFQKASASKLPFENGSMGTVVSCLTFHEVQDVVNKADSISEALRVLAPGGTFTFFDLFDDPQHFSGRESIRRAIAEQGGRITSEKRLSEILPLPFPLDTAKVLKYAVLVCGEKTPTV